MKLGDFEPDDSSAHSARFFLVRLVLLSTLFCAAQYSNASPSPRIKLLLQLDKVVAVSDPRSPSFQFSPSFISGGPWWAKEGSGFIGKNYVKPLDFSSLRLRTLTQNLTPALLSISDTESDALRYDMTIQSDLICGPDDKNTPFHCILTGKQWDAVHGFVKETGVDMQFTLNAGPSTRLDGVWDPAMARHLLEYSAKKNYSFSNFQLGNETNVYPIFYGTKNKVSGKQYASDFEVARNLIREYFPRPLAGPTSAYWPVIGEVFAIPFGVTKDFIRRVSDLEVFSYHYYPTQSERCPFGFRWASLEKFLKPETLNAIQKIAKKINSQRNRMQPNAEIWASETGPAQCGGQRGLSDRFISGFWWLDHLGLLGRLGHKMIVRQALIGSDYGLLAEDTLEPRPDYWNSFLWKKIMGTKTLEATPRLPRGTTRIYATCTRDSFQGVLPGSVSLLLLNLSKKTQEIEWGENLNSNQRIGALQWEITAPDLLATHVLVNGEKPELNSQAQATLPPPKLMRGAESFVLKPYSYQFLVLPNAGAPACD